MAEIDFRTTSLAELTRSVRAKEVSARELTQAALDRIQRLDPTYNAFVAVDGERALAEADGVDDRIAAGADPGPLAGIPLGVKDLQNAIGYRTTYGSALHADDPPATADDPFVARMRAAGCVVVGKTNTPEFGWMGNTTNAIFGPSLNPFDTSRGPGGSSGGCGGGAGGRDGAARHRVRRRRIHPDPLGLLRPLGHEAEPRPRPGRRPQPARLDRPLDQRPHGPPHRRCRPGPRRRRRPRPHRPALPPPPRGQLDGGPRRPPRPGQDRLRPHPRLRHRRHRGGRRLRARRRGAGVAGRRRRRAGLRVRCRPRR